MSSPALILRRPVLDFEAAPSISISACDERELVDSEQNLMVSRNDEDTIAVQPRNGTAPSGPPYVFQELDIPGQYVRLTSHGGDVTVVPVRVLQALHAAGFALAGHEMLDDAFHAWLELRLARAALDQFRVTSDDYLMEAIRDMCARALEVIDEFLGTLHSINEREATVEVLEEAWDHKTVTEEAPPWATEDRTETIMVSNKSLHPLMTVAGQSAGRNRVTLTVTDDSLFPNSVGARLVDLPGENLAVDLLTDWGGDRLFFEPTDDDAGDVAYAPRSGHNYSRPSSYATDVIRQQTDHTPVTRGVFDAAVDYKQASAIHEAVRSVTQVLEGFPVDAHATGLTTTIRTARLHALALAVAASLRESMPGRYSHHASTLGEPPAEELATDVIHHLMVVHGKARQGDLNDLARKLEEVPFVVEEIVGRRTASVEETAVKIGHIFKGVGVDPG
jgi:hypothetical protein